jgi:hypothetical protein
MLNLALIDPKLAKQQIKAILENKLPSHVHVASIMGEVTAKESLQYGSLSLEEEEDSGVSMLERIEQEVLGDKN